MKHAVFLGLALASLAFSPAPAEAQVSPDTRTMLVATGPGGNVIDFARRVSSARLGGHWVAFSGRCESACTLFLSLPATSTCITPGTSFTFHRPYGATEDFNSWAADFMLTNYPGWVRNWIASQGGLTDQPLRMDYAYAARFIPPCSGGAPVGMQS
jgi:hypothetical protein